jgi:hypothetical protein
MPTEPESTTETEPAVSDPPVSDPAASDDAGDDYGYDLAHEVKDALKIPVTRRRTPAPQTGTGRPPEQDGDLGYDDAHEIRGS